MPDNTGATASLFLIETDQSPTRSPWTTVYPRCCGRSTTPSRRSSRCPPPRRAQRWRRGGSRCPTSTTPSAEDRAVDTGGRGRISGADLSTARTRRRACPGVVFLHGGGFVLCDIESHDGFCRAMAAHTGDGRRIRRLPAGARASGARRRGGRVRGVRLGRRATRPNSASIRNASRSRGTAPAATWLRWRRILCRERGTAPPAAQILLYPVIDPRMRQRQPPSSRATGYVTTRAALQWYWRQYLGGAALPEPAHLVAPGRADIAQRVCRPRSSSPPPSIRCTTRAEAYARTAARGRCAGDTP